MSLPFPLVLDGGFATELERQFGKDLSGKLWSAKCLDEDPAAVQAVHLSYFEAGANIATTCSYQATVEGFMDAQYTKAQAESLLKKSVALARQARDQFKISHPEDTQPRLVALSMGCYGAKLANGAEYTGNYGDGITKEDLIEFHKDRLRIFLQEPGIDLILFETIPSGPEAEAIHDLVKHFDQQQEMTSSRLPPVAVSFSCKSNDKISDGTPLSQCIGYFDDLDTIVAVGVNCTKLRYIPSLVTILVDKLQRTDKAVLLYPDGGDDWDAVDRIWIPHTKPSVEAFYEVMAQVVEKCGTKVMIGGCCGTQTSHISVLRENLPL